MLIILEAVNIFIHEKAKIVRRFSYIALGLYFVLMVLGGLLDNSFHLLEALKGNNVWRYFNYTCIVLAVISFAYLVMILPILLICATVVVNRGNTLRKEFKRDLKQLDHEFPREKTKEYYVRKLDLYYVYRLDELDPYEDQPRWTYYEASQARIELIKICHELYRYVSTLEKRTQNQIYEVLKVAGYLKEAEKVRIYLEIIDTTNE